MSEVCSITGCTDRMEYRSLQLCRVHYNARRTCRKRKRHGDDCSCWEHLVRQRDKPRVCTHAGCSEPVRCSGLCALHYERSRSGRPLDDEPDGSCSECGTAIPATRVANSGMCQRCYQRTWKDPARHLISNGRNRAVKVGAEVRSITYREAARLLASPCAYCGSRDGVEGDHIVPLTRGGRHAIGNLAPCCADCNKAKKARLLVEWRAAP